jgi:class 3 adenylate cyclase
MRINDLVEARGGVLKKVTYHLSGSDMVIYFGLPNAYPDDTWRAVETALDIRALITALEPLAVGGALVDVACQIGIASGPVFAAEIGEPRGRREFNVLGDPVNVAARLMNRAAGDQILMTASIYSEVIDRFQCQPLGTMSLKGKTLPMPVFELCGRK